MKKTALSTADLVGQGNGRKNELPVQTKTRPERKLIARLCLNMDPKLILAMRITAFILLLGCLHVSAATISQTVTISGRDMPLKKVFQVIKQQTGYTVFGNGVLLKDANSITIHALNMPLNDFLDTIFRDQPLSYRIVDQTNILFFKRTVATPLIVAEPGLFNDRPSADPLPISGIVVTGDDIPLEGVSVKVKGAKGGVFTDADGRFNIYAEPTQVLVFSHVSMLVVETRVIDFPADRKIRMTYRNATLNDVVITGYGNIRKESFTGTYTQVTKDEILKVSPNNLIAALQTFDPSFRITQNINMGSNPNMLPEFYLRGQSGFPGVKDLDKITSGADVSQFSLKNDPNTPIFILDGFEVGVEKIYDMDINRISNVTILKDAAATAMYGSRASNGVVVIETVIPRAGRFNVNYNGNYSVTAPDLSSYNMMDAQQKLDAEMAARVYLPNLPENSPYYESRLVENLWYMEQKRNEIRKGVNTYWLSQPLSVMFNTRHNIFVEGGSEGLRVGLDLKYDNQNGVMKESFRKRVSTGFTVQYQTRSLQIRNQAYFDGVRSAESPYGLFSQYTAMQPYYPIYDENTGLYLRNMPNFTGTTPINPLYESTVGNFNRSNYKEFTNNLTANWRINNFLLLKTQFAIDYKDTRTNRFISPESTTYPTGDPFTKGELNQMATSMLDWNTNMFLSYNKNIEANNVNVTAGINAKSTAEDFSNSTYRGFPGKEYYSPSYAYEMLRKPVLNDNKKRLLGSFLTVNYSRNNIFLLDGSFRMDGSSEFGTERKWAPFWSVGSGINMHNVKLFKAKNTFDIFRITANIGQTGKSNFSPYMARNTYEVLLDDWYPTGIGSSLIYMGNSRLTWEKQVSWNVGTLISLKKRFSLELNYYNKETYDLITDVSLPSSSGFMIYRDNIGKVLNRGFEVKTIFSVINQRNFNVTLTGNLAHNKNKIVEIAESLKSYNNRIDEYFKEYRTSNDPYIPIGFYAENAKFARPVMKYEEGGSLTAIYGMKSLGINPANGKEVFVKRDGTVTQDWSAAEQQVIGNTEPVARGTFGMNVRYKRFSVYTTFMYEWGGDQYNQTLSNNVENVNLLYSNADVRVLTDRWQKPGDITPLKSIHDRYLITRPTSRFIQKNNYISFNSFSISYDFDPGNVKMFGMQFLRTTFLMNDVALFSSIKREMGLDYPFARTFTFTINASF